MKCKAHLAHSLVMHNTYVHRQTCYGASNTPAYAAGQVMLPFYECLDERHIEGLHRVWEFDCPKVCPMLVSPPLLLPSQQLWQGAGTSWAFGLGCCWKIANLMCSSHLKNKRFCRYWTKASKALASCRVL